MRRSRSYVLGATLLALALFLGACGSGEDDTTGGDTGGSEDKPALTVGAVAFAENQIVAEMYAQVLENAGYEVDRQTDLGSREILQPALEAGEVDIAPEYLGSLLLFLDPAATATGVAEDNVAQLEPLLEEHGQVLLEPAEADDSNAFVVTAETSDKYGITKVSDLKADAGKLTLGGPPECPKRPFCIPGLEKTYGVEFGDFIPLDIGGPLTVAALDKGKIDVALLFSTSSVIGSKGWVLLEDDKDLQAAENITPVVSADVASDEIASLLNEVSALLTTENITTLNGLAEIEGQDPAQVAEDFLKENGLL
jgi:osmoprotectant transport system substrate-binding protein